MSETTLIHLSRLMALRRRLDVAANNVANVETTGFRAQQISFHEYLKPEKGEEIGIKPERPLSLVDAAFALRTRQPGRYGRREILSIWQSKATPISWCKHLRENATPETGHLAWMELAGW